MLKSEEVVYDGVKFVCTQFSALRAGKLVLRLAKTVGPTLAALSAGQSSMGDLQAMAPMLLPKIAEALTSLDTDEAISLMVDLLAGTEAFVTDEKGTRKVALIGQAAIDNVFTTRLKAMFSCVVFAIKVNFGDFFDESVLQGAPVLAAP